MLCYTHCNDKRNLTDLRLDNEKKEIKKRRKEKKKIEFLDFCNQAYNSVLMEISRTH